MRISLNWLKKYVKIPEEVSDEELVRLIGARLVEVEGIIDETHKYDNIYIVRVESCEKIPETHLTLCQINVGKTELIQVVCGASNVREGMLAVWIAPGAVVPASVKEDAPFVIGKRKMQGYESSGMLAGADELDFGDDHSGIVEIDPDLAKPGDSLADVFDLKDLILEIENKSLTHRPDTFGIIGFAREIAGILGEKFDEKHLTSELHLSGRFAGSSSGVSTNSRLARLRAPLRQNSGVDLSIKISSPDICPRYTALVLEKHGELSKKYLTYEDTLLCKSGMKPISPIVDATNYLMLVTGQPLHAFDYDKFVAVGNSDKPEIHVRIARAGEKLVLLDDTEIELTENDIVICSGETPVALAGAMGGKSTMIDENTRNVILESATFSLYNLRKTQMEHGIFSEAITRFTKGQPPYQTLMVAECCAKMLEDGFRVSEVADEYPYLRQDIVVKITTDEINGLLGTKYGDDLIVKTLGNVGFEVKKRNSNLEIVVPAWRMDIHIKEDIIEEVGRLLGFDNIEATLPNHATANKNVCFELKKQLRDLMMRLGANEVLTYSFVSEKLLDKVGQDKKNSYKIINSISPELQLVRQSIVPSLLDKTYLNEKLPVNKFAIFEMNKVHRKQWGLDAEGVPVEKNVLGFVIAERKYNDKTAFYQAKKYVAKIFEELQIKVEFLPMKSNTAESKPFEPKRSADIFVDGELIGVVGEFRNSVRNDFKLADYLAGFEIDLDLALEKQQKHKQIDFKKKEARDLTVVADLSYAEVVKKIQSVLDKYGIEAEITPVSVYQADNSNEKHISVHLEFDRFNEEIMSELEQI